MTIVNVKDPKHPRRLGPPQPRGSKVCACGKVISINKYACMACWTVTLEKQQAQATRIAVLGSSAGETDAITS